MLCTNTKKRRRFSFRWVPPLARRAYPGITSENVAKKYNISRREQDEFAASSYQKAERAQKTGLFDEEIYPVTVKYVDPKTGSEGTKTVSKDDGIRAGTTVESLSRLKPAFSKDGSTHAGNASQVSDGAAAVILTKRSVAEKYGLPIQGKFIAASVVGVPPAIMGVGPAYAIPKLLEKVGLSIGDIDIFEINEAFASQCLYSAQVSTKSVPAKCRR
jgi:acetyl-CoA acyltransferase 1